MHGGIIPKSVDILKPIEVAGVGDVVLQPVRDNTFLLLTHPNQVRDVLVQRAIDPEGVAGDAARHPRNDYLGLSSAPVVRPSSTFVPTATPQSPYSILFWTAVSGRGSSAMT